MREGVRHLMENMQGLGSKCEADICMAAFAALKVIGTVGMPQDAKNALAQQDSPDARPFFIRALGFMQQLVATIASRQLPPATAMQAVPADSPWADQIQNPEAGVAKSAAPADPLDSIMESMEPTSDDDLRLAAILLDGAAPEDSQEDSALHHGSPDDGMMDWCATPGSPFKPADALSQALSEKQVRGMVRAVALDLAHGDGPDPREVSTMVPVQSVGSQLPSHPVQPPIDGVQPPSGWQPAAQAVSDAPGLGVSPEDDFGDFLAGLPDCDDDLVVGNGDPASAQLHPIPEEGELDVAAQTTEQLAAKFAGFPLPEGPRDYGIPSPDSSPSRAVRPVRPCSPMHGHADVPYFPQTPVMSPTRQDSFSPPQAKPQQQHRTRKEPASKLGVATPGIGKAARKGKRGPKARQAPSDNKPAWPRAKIGRAHV